MLKDISCFTAPIPLTTPEILTPNVAPNGTATQSSNYHHSTRFTDPDYAFYAIDGIFATDILDAHARCSLTLHNSPGNWWKLDLLSNHIVENIALTTRKNGGRFFKFNLFGICLNQVLNIISNYSTLLVANKKLFFTVQSATHFLAMSVRLNSCLIYRRLIFQNWLYKDVCRKIMNNQHQVCILEANYYLSVYVDFNLVLSTEQKNHFSLIKFCHCTLKSRKILNFVIRKRAQKIMQNVFIYSQQTVKFLHWCQLQFRRSFIQTVRARVDSILRIGNESLRMSTRNPRQICHHSFWWKQKRIFTVVWGSSARRTWVHKSCRFVTLHYIQTTVRVRYWTQYYHWGNNFVDISLVS